MYANKPYYFVYLIGLTQIPLMLLMPWSQEKQNVELQELQYYLHWLQIPLVFVYPSKHVIQSVAELHTEHPETQVGQLLS